MLADERGAFKTFRPTPGSADKVTFTPSPLAPFTPAEQAYHSELSTSLLSCLRLFTKGLVRAVLEKYHADKGRKPPYKKEGADRLWLRAVGRSAESKDAETLLKIFVASVKKRTDEQKRSPPWLTTIIDEAHFLRNPLAYWSILATDIGTHSQR